MAASPFKYAPIRFEVRDHVAVATLAFVAILALWFYPGRGIVKNVRLLRHPEVMLTSQVAASNAFGRALGAERGVFDPLNHPVVVRDLSYYWTQFAFVRQAIAQVGIDAPPCHCRELEDVQDAGGDACVFRSF